MKLKKICIVVGSRANYSSIKSAMLAIKNHPDLELQVVANASAILERFGNVAALIEKDGFEINAKVHMLLEGETPITMAKSTGIGLMELPGIFELLEPDVVVTVGDRFETMATVLSASYMNIPLAHTMGGEVSGNIDENIRHAVTKLSHIHFAACSDAKDRILRLGEEPSRVHNVGCPRMDLIKDFVIDDNDLEEIVFSTGVGHRFSLKDDFILVSQHPITGEFGLGENQISTTLEAVNSLNVNTLVLWPNADAGAEDVSRGIRKFREQQPSAPIFYLKNLPPEVYAPLMFKTRCLVGNSSSGIRDGAFIGTPAVNIGTRQLNRQRGKNVIDVGYSFTEIKNGILDRFEYKGRLKSEPIYGDGNAGIRIADLLASEKIDIEKTITY